MATDKQSTKQRKKKASNRKSRGVDKKDMVITPPGAAAHPVFHPVIFQPNQDNKKDKDGEYVQLVLDGNVAPPPPPGQQVTPTPATPTFPPMSVDPQAVIGTPPMQKRPPDVQTLEPRKSDNNIPRLGTMPVNALQTQLPVVVNKSNQTPKGQKPPSKIPSDEDSRSDSSEGMPKKPQDLGAEALCPPKRRGRDKPSTKTKKKKKSPSKKPKKSTTPGS